MREGLSGIFLKNDRGEELLLKACLYSKRGFSEAVCKVKGNGLNVNLKVIPTPSKFKAYQEAYGPPRLYYVKDGQPARQLLTKRDFVIAGLKYMIITNLDVNYAKRRKSHRINIPAPLTPA